MNTESSNPTDSSSANSIVQETLQSLDEELEVVKEEEEDTSSGQQTHYQETLNVIGPKEKDNEGGAGVSWKED